MAKFTVRIELQGVPNSSPLYALLDEAMLRRGFGRIVTSHDGQKYDLPTGEYAFEGEKSGEDVRAAAKEAVGVTERAGSVLVIESVVRWWNGLRSSV
jgi:hypothetical protein